MELNFNSIRAKDFINVYDGKFLGRAEDIVFEQESSSVKGFVVPLPRKGFGFKKPESIFVSIDQIKKIGDDVILVDVRPQNDPLERAARLVPKQFKRVIQKEYEPAKRLPKTNKNVSIKK